MTYTAASTLSLIIAWFVALTWHGGYSYLNYGSLKDRDTIVVAFWSFLFVMLANGLFIQWPERFISRFCRSTSRLNFLLASVIYGIAVFTLLIGWLFLTTDFLIVYVDAAIIGLVFGFCFPRLWKFAKPL